MPSIRSYHMHVMFSPHHGSDDCTGFDEAMELRRHFMASFNLTEVSPPCSGDFDQGRLCMFRYALGPAGPFLSPQWAVRPLSLSSNNQIIS